MQSILLVKDVDSVMFCRLNLTALRHSSLLIFQLCQQPYSNTVTYVSYNPLFFREFPVCHIRDFNILLLSSVFLLDVERFSLFSCIIL
jgi:hypothetical protein